MSFFQGPADAASPTPSATLGSLGLAEGPFLDGLLQQLPAQGRRLCNVTVTVLLQDVLYAVHEHRGQLQHVCFGPLTVDCRLVCPPLGAPRFKLATSVIG